MKALFLRDNLQLSLEETEKPSLLKDNDVIVRVTAASICGSDIHFWRGKVPCIPNFIIGHECVGVVDEVGKNVQNVRAGDRVSVPAGPYCGTCRNCSEGKVYACTSATAMLGGGKLLGDLPGCHSEYIRVPFGDSCLVPIPDSVSDKEALLVGDILSTGYFAVTNGNPQPGNDVAIFGAGPVGLCAVAAARIFTPARIFLIDIEDYRLELGLRMGATHVLNPAKCEAAKEIKKLSGGRGVDYSIDAVGIPQTLNECIRCNSVGGIVSVVGVGPAKMEIHMRKLFYKNLTLKTGYVPLNQMQRLMTLIETGHIDTTPLITHEMPLSNIIEGYEIFGDKKDNCIKVMIVPD